MAKKILNDSGDQALDLEAQLRRAEDLCDFVEQAYVEKNCGRDKIPLFEWDLHTNEE